MSNAGLLINYLVRDYAICINEEEEGALLSRLLFSVALQHLCTLCGTYAGPSGNCFCFCKATFVLSKGFSFCPVISGFVHAFLSYIHPFLFLFNHLFFSKCFCFVQLFLFFPALSVFVQVFLLFFPTISMLSDCFCLSLTISLFPQLFLCLSQYVCVCQSISFLSNYVFFVQVFMFLSRHVGFPVLIIIPSMLSLIRLRTGDSTMEPLVTAVQRNIFTPTQRFKKVT